MADAPIPGWQAYATGHASVASLSPRMAATKFFECNPKARKCSLAKGEIDGPFFTIRLALRAKSQTPTSYYDVTRKTAPTLPNTTEVPAE